MESSMSQLSPITSYWRAPDLESPARMHRQRISIVSRFYTMFDSEIFFRKALICWKVLMKSLFQKEISAGLPSRHCALCRVRGVSPTPRPLPRDPHAPLRSRAPRGLLHLPPCSPPTHQELSQETAPRLNQLSARKGTTQTTLGRRQQRVEQGIQ